MRLIPICALLLLTAYANAQKAPNLPFSAGNSGDVAAVEKAMPALADQVIPVYKEVNRATYLDNLFRLQIVARRYADALQTLATLQKLIVNPQSPATAAYNVQESSFRAGKRDRTDRARVV